MSASLTVQKAIRARLVASSGVTALVSADSILDRNARPAPDPSIIIGEGQSIDDGRIARNVERVYSTVDIWKKEIGLTGVSAIAGEIRSAIHSARLSFDAGFHCADCFVSSIRFLRDPDGETAHAVLTVETLVGESG